MVCGQFYTYLYTHWWKNEQQTNEEDMEKKEAIERERGNDEKMIKKKKHTQTVWETPCLQFFGWCFKKIYSVVGQT